MEAQTLRFQVTILSSGRRVEGASGWFGTRVVGPKKQAVGLEVLAVNPSVQVIRLEAGIIRLRDRAIGLGVPEASPKRLRDALRVKVANVGGVNRVQSLQSPIVYILL